MRTWSSPRPGFSVAPLATIPRSCLSSSPSMPLSKLSTKPTPRIPPPILPMVRSPTAAFDDLSLHTGSSSAPARPLRPGKVHFEAIKGQDRELDRAIERVHAMNEKLNASAARMEEMKKLAKELEVLTFSGFLLPVS